MGSEEGGRTNRISLSLLLAAGSLIITVICYLLGLPFFFLFLFFPFLSWWGRNETKNRCPVCGYEGSGGERFCPYDGTKLE